MDYPMVEIVLKTEIDGKEYKKRVVINLKHVSEIEVKDSLNGYIGSNLKALLLDVIRTDKYMKK